MGRVPETAGSFKNEWAWKTPIHDKSVDRTKGGVSVKKKPGGKKTRRASEGTKRKRMALKTGSGKRRPQKV